MDEEYSYEVRRGRSFDEDPEFNDNYADQEVADHESLMERKIERSVRLDSKGRVFSLCADISKIRPNTGLILERHPYLRGRYIGFCLYTLFGWWKPSGTLQGKMF